MEEEERSGHWTGNGGGRKREGGGGEKNLATQIRYFGLVRYEEEGKEERTLIRFQSLILLEKVSNIMS